MTSADISPFPQGGGRIFQYIDLWEQESLESRLIRQNTFIDPSSGLSSWDMWEDVEDFELLDEDEEE
jgi:hypothetical protein